MALYRVAGSVQETYETSNPVNLVFLEPPILLKDEPLLEYEHTRGTEGFLLSLMAKNLQLCKQQMGLSDVIPVIPLPVCMTIQLAQSPWVKMPQGA